jgi:acyl-CoA thioester hydrolase
MNPSSDNEAFAWPVRVYYEDTDAQGLVYFANYFKFMERARSEWLRSLGIEQDRLLFEQKRCFVVVDCQAEFLRPARFNDQLVATVAVLERGRTTFSLEQQILRPGRTGELLCRGTTRAACINSETLKPVRLPEFIVKDSDHVN